MQLVVNDLGELLKCQLSEHLKKCIQQYQLQYFFVQIKDMVQKNFIVLFYSHHLLLKYLADQILCKHLFFIIKVSIMNKNIKKYSKISPALKSCFLFNIYYHRFTIKEAADRCKINYSTAKIILKELNQKQRSFINRIIQQKEVDSQTGKIERKVCNFNFINTLREEQKIQKKIEPKIEVISRVGYDFFEEAKNDEEN